MIIKLNVRQHDVAGSASWRRGIAAIAIVANTNIVDVNGMRRDGSKPTVAEAMRQAIGWQPPQLPIPRTDAPPPRSARGGTGEDGFVRDTAVQQPCGPATTDESAIPAETAAAQINRSSPLMVLLASYRGLTTVKEKRLEEIKVGTDYFISKLSDVCKVEKIGIANQARMQNLCDSVQCRHFEVMYAAYGIRGTRTTDPQTALQCLAAKRGASIKISDRLCEIQTAEESFNSSFDALSDFYCRLQPPLDFFQMWRISRMSAQVMLQLC